MVDLSKIEVPDKETKQFVDEACCIPQDEYDVLQADRKRYRWWKMHPHAVVANVDMEKTPWELTFSITYLDGVFDTVDEAIDAAMREESDD